ncbi:MAG: hypothetical protein VB106_06905 [Clostridiaceae bacterium]|jgi:uncharacterized membrane protein|nr:hypothetical protein [Clostridiaceae bacterium]
MNTEKNKNDFNEQQKVQDENDDSKISYVVLGMLFGVGLGSAIGGILFNNMIAGIIVGLCLGITLGALIESGSNR